MWFSKWLFHEEAQKDLARAVSQWIENTLGSALRQYWANPKGDVLSVLANLLGGRKTTEPGGQPAIVLSFPPSLPAVAGKPLYLTNHGNDDSATNTDQSGTMLYMRLDLGLPEKARSEEQRRAVLDHLVIASHEAGHIFQPPRTDNDRQKYQQALNQEDPVAYRLDKNEIEAHAMQFAQLWANKYPGVPYKLNNQTADQNTLKMMTNLVGSAQGNTKAAGKYYFGVFRKPKYIRHMIALDSLIADEVSKRRPTAR